MPQDMPEAFADLVIDTLIEGVRVRPMMPVEMRVKMLAELKLALADAVRENPVLPLLFGAALQHVKNGQDGHFGQALMVFSGPMTVTLGILPPLIVLAEEVDRLREENLQLKDRLLDAQIGADPPSVQNLADLPLRGVR